MLVPIPSLKATMIFETLRGRPDQVSADGQLRTVQRRRVLHGPEREIMFPHTHRSGEYAQSDVTSMPALAISFGR